MVEPINVPYSRQLADGYCLPACAQMVLAHLGISRSQREIADVLDLVENLGVPASHIQRLRSRGIAVHYQTEGDLDELQSWLAQSIPIIVFVQTSLLGYWHGRLAQHAVVVVGMDDEAVYLLDPAKTEAVIQVTTGEFLLAWDEMEFAYGVIAR